MEDNARGSEYAKVKANRLAFHPASRNNDQPSFFSWVVEGKLAGMAFPTSASQLKTLLSSYNVGLVCSLIEESQCPPLSMFQASQDSPEVGPESLHIEWRDMSIPSRKQMDDLLKITQEFIDKDMAVVYHCFGGKGRTGTALACYLLKFLPDQFNAENVIEHIRELRPKSVETSSQELFIRNYERYLKGEPLLHENPYTSPEASIFTIKLRKVDPHTPSKSLIE
jgi:atypical dual specificity phosphatase